MALKPCKECKQEVSTKAKSCPHCGAKNPTVSGKETAQGCLGIIVLSIIIAVVVNSCGDDDATTKPKEPAKTPKEIAAENAACRQDLQCWATKHIITAQVYCPDLIENLAKYQFEWTDGWVDSKFTHFSWKDKTAGTITYFGDKLKLQNGFGAFQNYTYSCLVDTNTDSILDIGAQPGKL
jgi:hypothetical protein